MIIYPFLEKNNLKIEDINHLIFHPGGKKIVHTVESLFKNRGKNIDDTKVQISIKTRQNAKRQRTWARNQMIDWENIDHKKLNSFTKNLKISSLKLDQ